MELLIIWASISITIGYLKLNNKQYILFSLVMLFVTYFVNNEINRTTMSIKTAVLLSAIPNSCFWYLAYHCNNFLWVYPYEWGIFMAIFCIYSYILIYVALEC